jgi:hypothetical protein
MDFTAASPTGAPVSVLDLRTPAGPHPSGAYGPATAVTPPDAGTRAQPHNGFRPGADGRGQFAADEFNPYQDWDGNADGWIDDPLHFLEDRRRHYEAVWRAHEEGVARAQAAARQAQLDAIATSRPDATVTGRAIAAAGSVAATPSPSSPTSTPDIALAGARERITLVELPEPAAVDVHAAATAYTATVAATSTAPPPSTSDARYL